MAKMTKADIQKRQLEIMTKMDEMDEKTNVREAKMRTLTSEEQKDELAKLQAEQREQDIKYDALVRESAGLSARAKAMATGKEMENIREREDYGAKIRAVFYNSLTRKFEITSLYFSRVNEVLPVVITVAVPAATPARKISESGAFSASFIAAAATIPSPAPTVELTATFKLLQ